MLLTVYNRAHSDDLKSALWAQSLCSLKGILKITVWRHYLCFGFEAPIYYCYFHTEQWSLNLDLGSFIYSHT